jgi:hypothetical protein
MVIDDCVEGWWAWSWWRTMTMMVMIIVINFVKLTTTQDGINYYHHHDDHQLSIYLCTIMIILFIYLSMFRHPFIIKYYDRIIDKPKTRLYIIMEYCSKGWRSYTINLIQTMTIQMIRCCFFLYTSSW